ncbi:aminotransferase class I/II-fold pyridoxal phosphate-dependent enzyme [Plantactinospora sp. S1510]|uniref:cysteine-S-conjugate beta-lyase n=1 Tax=Plantactinospora alkalitolerans TaxID=2789879 RepID=A0ABS0H809_9ACTN|nr:aminotransferase class I/II-fold pyridoxal phosphate-dependent enzyme [Plantactinospora alkalitolerans]MBF9134599.1 aminotransferase class I/II-fold pyridoxal phosphate-dependent enzyme [Plantactinospora alkalitolerans]
MLSLADLRRRTSEKWRRYPPDVLPAWVAEMDVPLAEPVAQALTEAIARSDTGYPIGTAYAEALAEFATQRWGWTPEIEHIAVVPDVMLGIVEVLKLVTGHGDAVVINPPVYPPFFDFVAGMDRRVVEAPLGAEHRLDPEALDRAFAEAVAGGRRAAFLLCSPHNPTGTVHTADELAMVTELADRHGVRVVVDEIHAPLVHSGATFLPYLSLPGSERGFALLSASKAWNLAGVKAAVAVAGPEAAADLARMPKVAGDGASHLGVLGHVAALRYGGPWLDGLLAGLDHNRRLLGALLADQLPQVRYRIPDGTYLAWLDCRELELPGGPADDRSADPAEVFLERGRVAVVPGAAFGTGGAGHVRFNFGTSEELVTEAVRRMAAALR